MAEDLLFQKKYEQASATYDSLCTMKFSVLDRDIEEWDELELEGLVEEKLVELDFTQNSLNLMYAKYQVSEGEERTAALYGYLTWDMCKSIKIDEIFTVGPEELKEIDLFMQEWIFFLKKTNGDLAGDLLLEACNYRGGIGLLCETAREESARHPVL